MDGGCTVSHANGEHSWTGTDDAVRAPGLHVLSFNAGVAQSVERSLSKSDVIGSNPIACSNFC